MNKFKVLEYLFIVFAVLLSDVMFAVVAYSYCELQWGGKYELWSAPKSVAFFYAIPFIVGILICFLLACFFYKKSK